MMMNEINDNYLAVMQRIDLASVAAKRKHPPKLLAVSKKHAVDKIIQLNQLGQHEFGESYVQEAVDKIEQLKGLALTWHFIGPIQSNKTKLIAEHFDWVQSVDRMKILTRLDQQRPKGLQPLKVLLQYKVGDETSKSGASKQDILAMIEALKDMESLSFKGLMCIPPPSHEKSIQQAYFSEVLQLFEQIKGSEPQADTLSIGMSGDLESAIEMGSTMVRVGTDLFGPRL